MIEKAKWLISALWGRYKLDKKLKNAIKISFSGGGLALKPTVIPYFFSSPREIFI